MTYIPGANGDDDLVGTLDDLSLVLKDGAGVRASAYAGADFIL